MADSTITDSKLFEALQPIFSELPKFGDKGTRLSTESSTVQEDNLLSTFRDTETLLRYYLIENAYYTEQYKQKLKEYRDKQKTGQEVEEWLINDILSRQNVIFDIRRKIAAIYMCAWTTKKTPLPRNPSFARKYWEGNKHNTADIEANDLVLNKASTIGHTDFFYTEISYTNFLRLTAFKAINITQDFYLLTAASSAALAGFVTLLNDLSYAGAAIFALRVFVDVMCWFIFTVQAWSNANPSNKHSFYEHASLLWNKDNRGHRILNNAVWCVLMCLKLFGDAAIQATFPYTFAAGYLFDLCQDLWKASNKLKQIEEEFSTIDSHFNAKIGEIREQQEKKKELEVMREIATQQKLTQINNTAKDSMAYYWSYYGVLLGSVGVLLALGGAVGTIQFWLPLAVVVLGLGLAIAFLCHTYSKQEPENRVLFYLAGFFTAGLYCVYSTYSNSHLDTENSQGLYKTNNQLIIGVVLAIALVLTCMFLPASPLLPIVVMIVGLIATGVAQGWFTINKDRGEKLYNLGSAKGATHSAAFRGAAGLAAPLVMLSATTLIAFTSTHAVALGIASILGSGVLSMGTIPAIILATVLVWAALTLIIRGIMYVRSLNESSNNTPVSHASHNTLK